MKDVAQASAPVDKRGEGAGLLLLQHQALGNEVGRHAKFAPRKLWFLGGPPVAMCPNPPPIFE
jgi:hypothetical protein